MNYSLAVPNSATSKQVFFRLSTDISKKLREAKLTAGEWRLWSLLATLDPFGDRYTEMPCIEAIQVECKISAATIYRAIAKFTKLGWFCFDAPRKFCNLNTENKNAKMRTLSQKCESSFNHENELSAMRLPEAESVEVTEFQSSQTVQTYSDIKDNTDTVVAVVNEENNFLNANSLELSNSCDEIPQCKQLRNNGVNLADPRLLKACSDNCDSLALSVAAWLEWAKTKCVEKPTRSLIRAIEQRWQPESTAVSSNVADEVVELVPVPNDEQMNELLQLRRVGGIRGLYQQPWGAGTAWVVDTGKVALPWWEYSFE